MMEKLMEMMNTVVFVGFFIIVVLLCSIVSKLKDELTSVKMICDKLDSIDSFMRENLEREEVD